MDANASDERPNITPSAFWREYRAALISRQQSDGLNGWRGSDHKRLTRRRSGGIWMTLPEWTALTCHAACEACARLGLEPWPELGRFDVVGVRWRRYGELRIWGVVYEHEAAPGMWRHELRKLWHVSADLRVLVGYQRDREPVRTRLQAEIARLRAATPVQGEGTWLFIFGIAAAHAHPSRAWRVWTLNPESAVVEVSEAQAFFPARRRERPLLGAQDGMSACSKSMTEIELQ